MAEQVEHLNDLLELCRSICVERCEFVRKAFSQPGNVQELKIMKYY